jgi:hypothetical protein
MLGILWFIVVSFIAGLLTCWGVSTQNPGPGKVLDAIFWGILCAGFLSVAGEALIGAWLHFPETVQGLGVYGAMVGSVGGGQSGVGLIG